MPEVNLPFAVLWDMDGTLIDSEPYWQESEIALAADHNSAWSEDDSLSLIGKSLYDSSALLKDRFSSELHPHEIIDRLTSHVVSRLETKILWRPGAMELLFQLREAGVKTALVTMSMRRMALAVANSVGFDAFDFVVAGDDVTFGKPHPEAYQTAASQLGVSVEHCIALEDSPTGLASAEAAGIRTLAIENLVTLPPAPNRTVVRTLEGIDLTRLRAIYREFN
jgi:HAD superfamily hydrolase (TIGR01509 family)